LAGATLLLGIAQTWANRYSIWSDLMSGNKRFVEGKPKSRPLIAAREELYKGQRPQVIVLGCADSR
jgi:carbonic anhydrase